MFCDTREHFGTKFFAIVKCKSKIAFSALSKNTVRSPLTFNGPAGGQERFQRLRCLNGVPIHAQKETTGARACFPLLPCRQAYEAQSHKRAEEQRAWYRRTPERLVSREFRQSNGRLPHDQTPPQKNKNSFVVFCPFLQESSSYALTIHR